MDAISSSVAAEFDVLDDIDPYESTDTEFPVIQPCEVDPFGELIRDPNRDVNAVMFLIPSLFHQSPQATFLAYRSLGYTVPMAMKAANVSMALYHKWTDEDKEFILWEYKQLPVLQKTLSKHIARLSFMRNMMLCFGQDFEVLKKLQEPYGLESLSEREYKYLTTIRGKYSPTDLMAIERIISPEDYKGGEAVINLTWDTREQHVHIESGPAQVLLNGSGDPDQEISS